MPRHPRRTRRRYLLIVLLLVLMGGALWGAWFFLYGQWVEDTNDAYVNGNLVQITPRVAGTVTRIAADDNDRVQRGQTLVALDAADATVALQQAEAALGQAVREVAARFSAVDTATADVAMREAALQQAQADYTRRATLVRSGAISQEEVAHAHDALRTARSALAAAQAEQAAAQAQVAGADIATHPDVIAAAARVRAAWLASQRVRLPAPVGGFVAQRSVQLGQHVAPGTPLMAVVPLQSVWVDANFKETQLRHMRIGQPATLTADLYGNEVTYHGHVAGLGIGTGSAFALLPAQNATGNWIKIVQRLPVRIALDADELAEHPLRIGLSMNVAVDIHDRDGPALAAHPVDTPRLQTDAFADDARPVEARIAQIIARNRPDAGPKSLASPERAD